MRIIVAIDIIDGKCVRLTKGDYGSAVVYYKDPVDFARRTEDHGLHFIHLVDLDGARSQRVVNYKILERISSKTSLKIDFSGGIRSEEDVKIAFENGADQVTCGSIAVLNPEIFLEWLVHYGSDKIILGADSKNRKISTHGWMQNSEDDIIRYIKDYSDKGVRYTICTDIEKDGMLSGPSVDLYKEILKEIIINLIASGGIAGLADIEALNEAGCEGCIIGKALYEGKLTLKELSRLC